MKCLISVKIGVKLGVAGIHIHVAVMRGRITRVQFQEESVTDDGATEGAEGKTSISIDVG